MPVKTTARRSPQARRERTDDSACCSATRTSASLSPSAARRSWSRLATALWLLFASSAAAARRLLRSDDETRIVARMRSSWRFSPGSVSAAYAFSTSASDDSSSEALASSSTAPRRTPTSGESTRRPASAASSAPRVRLLLVTSSAPSGSVGGGAARRVGRLAVVDDEDLVAGDLDLVVEHRLHEGGEALVAARDRRVERLDARIVVAGGDRQRLLGGQREAPRRQRRRGRASQAEKRKDTNCHPERSEGPRRSAAARCLRDPSLRSG